MVRPLDKQKIEKIINTFEKHPEGTYVSQIARETKLPKSTVSFLLNTYLKDRIEDVIVGKKGLFKIIRLKGQTHES